MRSSVACLVLAAFAAPPLAAQRPAGAVPVKEWNVPWEGSRPRDPAVAPDGRIWFVGQVGNYVARLDPRSGRFEKFAIEEGAYPHNVVIDAQGNAWFAGNQNGTIGRIDARTGAVTRYPMPDPAARDPHTLLFDRHGNLWFTVQMGNFVGRLTVASGKVELVPVPTPRARPYGIALDASGRPFIALFGTNKIGTVDPKTLQFREYQLPAERARPRRIALTSDGTVWYDDYVRGFIGRLEPGTGQVKEWPMPAGKTSLPYAMTVDDADNLWLVETGIQPNRLVGFDPRRGEFFGHTEIPSGAGTVRYMVFDPKQAVIWFGTDANTIGKAEIAKARKPIS